MIRKSILAVLFASFCLKGMAQSISYNFDTKVIKADSLNLPESTIAKTIITILPEILERPGNYTINNYDVKVEGMPVGNAVDAVLTQIRLCDIDCIMVDESPLSSYQNNSKSGSINIVLRQRATEQKRYWGSASVDASYPMDIWPKLSVGYKKNKWTARALILGDHYHATYDTDKRTFNASDQELESLTTSRTNKFWSNMETLFLKYNATDKDQLELDVAYVGTNEKNELTYKSNEAVDHGQNKTEKADLNVYFNYSHKFAPSSSLNFEVLYNHHPDLVNKTDQENNIEVHNYADDLSGQLKFKMSLLPASSPYRSFFSLGTNAYMSFCDKQSDHIVKLLMLSHEFNDNVRSRGCTPFVQSESYFGPLSVKLSTNLLYYHYDFSRVGGERMHKDNTDVAGKLIVAWNMHQNHLLRFIAQHQIKRPAAEQIYPYLIMDPSAGQHVMGNFSLKNVKSNNTSLEYIFNRKWGIHSLLMNVSASFSHFTNIIGSDVIHSVDNDSFITYYNDGGDNKMLIGQFMATYDYKRLSLTLTTDYYNNISHLDAGHDHYRYLNAMLMPAFRTKTNWMGSLCLKYFSPVDTHSVHKGGGASASFQLGKSWGNLNVHAYGRLALSGRTTDTTYLGKVAYTEVTSDVIKNTIGLGIRYSF